ncbi:flagellar biosynthesis anti-sigma factor FlgM [uncultured Helicobacter sp.]|uniref:flagellar biosynthesis anti-sigma factor FlgM n=1 Tax=uncultured Helicobacter sp. TaxID=175537 RepID=UPI00260B9555|nr:flagellar biosynthesis anti-sigma factor FlgM [uncultured Helicobacter sp.]
MVRNTLERSLGSVYSQKIEKNQRERVQVETKKAEETQSLDRVAQIKEQVQNGTYQLDMKKTSEKMALHLLNL